MNYKCPVCAFGRLPFPPRNYHICPCCGTEFGNDDVGRSYSELRHDWITSGALWFFGPSPLGWNPWMQLLNGGYWIDVPRWGLVVNESPSSTMSAQRVRFADFVVATA